jgi:hypothetical protein
MYTAVIEQGGFRREFVNSTDKSSESIVNKAVFGAGG